MRPVAVLLWAIDSTYDPVFNPEMVIRPGYIDISMLDDILMLYTNSRKRSDTAENVW
jgi:hypothetical protein